MGLTFFRNEIPTDLSEMDLDKWIDLSPFMNQSPMILSDVAPAARVFNMFRTLGLRHLLLVNSDNRVTGMITRKDLLEENIEAALEASSPCGCCLECLVDSQHSRIIMTCFAARRCGIRCAQKPCAAHQAAWAEWSWIFCAFHLRR